MASSDVTMMEAMAGLFATTIALGIVFCIFMWACVLPVIGLLWIFGWLA